ncbi:MAG: hypothetical protein K5Q68_06640 [Roseococcus sp.]|nr:hypothetical protein [Roseococcus sp.]
MLAKPSNIEIVAREICAPLGGSGQRRILETPGDLAGPARDAGIGFTAPWIGSDGKAALRN